MLRRMFFILMLAMCFVITAACGAEDVIDNAMGGSPAEPAQTDETQLPAEDVPA